MKPADDPYTYQPALPRSVLAPRPALAQGSAESLEDTQVITPVEPPPVPRVRRDRVRS